MSTPFFVYIYPNQRWIMPKSLNKWSNNTTSNKANSNKKLWSHSLHILTIFISKKTLSLVSCCQLQFDHPGAECRVGGRGSWRWGAHLGTAGQGQAVGSAERLDEAILSYKATVRLFGRCCLDVWKPSLFVCLFICLFICLFNCLCVHWVGNCCLWKMCSLQVCLVNSPVLRLAGMEFFKTDNR